MKELESKLKEYLKSYYFIGGMPEAVDNYIKNRDLTEVRKIQNRLLEAYEQDFSKHAPTTIVPRIRQLWRNIPTQLAKENKKFIYGLIREGARAREYEIALSWLIDCGLIYQVNRVNNSKIPLSAYQDFNAFKLYLLDVGLLGAMAGIDAKTLLEGNEIFEEFKGTGNMELNLDRKLAEKRIFPAVDIYKSGTRREDLLLSDKEKAALWKLRKEMSNSSVLEVTDNILEALKRTKTNEEFINNINGI